MRPAILTRALAIAVFSSQSAISTEADVAAQCRQLLGRTLSTMQERTALKEELATGLMWLRLDALKALETGDLQGCLERARRAAALLKVD